MRWASNILRRNAPHRHRHRAPFRRHRLSNPFSLCYCSFKVYSLNEPLFSFGHKYSRLFRVWFSIGVGFGLAALFGISLVYPVPRHLVSYLVPTADNYLVLRQILLWELGRAIHIVGEITFIDMLFGTSVAVSKWNMSLVDAGCVFISTLVSVSIHELGHALAAASMNEVDERCSSRLDYVHGQKLRCFKMPCIVTEIPVTCYVLFPGALVAFDNDLLQEMPYFSALRIYCAGIWHNAVSCAAFGMMLLLLPWILWPIYIHGQNPLVLGVHNSSPLYGYLSPGDVIQSLDGIPIHDPQEWLDMSYVVSESLMRNTNDSYYDGGNTIGYMAKGFCVPHTLINESEEIQVVGHLSSCPPNLNRFVRTTCSSISVLDGHIDDNAYSQSSEHCLNSQEMVGRKRCGGRWLEVEIDDKSCICSEDEACLAPFQTQTSSWIEITYSYAYNLECGEAKDKLIGNFWFSEANISSCIRSFIYIGDVASLVDSVWLTGYRPRWAVICTYFPYILERILISIYHTSLLLVILNCLPVYFLDGEYILEVALCKVSLLSPRRRRRFLQGMLLAGTCISILEVLRIVHSTVI